jgi:energy-coupling factor transporter transmembrane protein EcfT
MAEAMEARAYGATARPTVMEVLTMRGEDWVVAAASTLLFVAALLTF